MADMAEKLLLLLAEKKGFDTLEVAKEFGVEHQKIVGAVKSLQAIENVSSPCSTVVCHTGQLCIPK